jgi:carboxyl-terminal processing protease
LNVFGDNTSSEFKKSLQDLRSKKMQGLIIDLRDNGGGYLESAVEILSEFVKK